MKKKIVYIEQYFYPEGGGQAQISRDIVLELNKKEREERIKAVQKRLDLQVKQSADLTAKSLALNEKAASSVPRRSPG